MAGLDRDPGTSPTAHLIDSALFGDVFSSPALRAVFQDANVLQKWLDVEAALAEAEAELDIIPAEAAREIRAQARAETMDFSRLKQEIHTTAHPLVPVIRALAQGCRNGAGEFVHWGATTQDITDTGTVLLIREALELIEERLDRVQRRLRWLAREHRDLAMVGRTHGQHALPITLGFKFAIYVSELDRHQERLDEARKRVLVGQFGGAVGSLASLDTRGLEVQSRLMDRLGLAIPVITWHTARDGLAELAGILAMIAASIGKIANEVRVLQRTEVAELEEPYAFGKVGSSTMPHKRNPMIAENVIASTKITRQAMPLLLDAMHQEHERDMSVWGIEWEVLPETFALVGGALEHCAWILEELRINRAALQRNLKLLNGLMLSEAIMMRLAPRIGRQRAHDIVYAVSMEAHDRGVSMRDALRGHPELADHLPEAELAELLDPEQYLGLCGVFVDRVLSRSATPNRLTGTS